LLLLLQKQGLPYYFTKVCNICGPAETASQGKYNLLQSTRKTFFLTRLYNANALLYGDAFGHTPKQDLPRRTRSRVLKK